jgi:hypothetical protein
MFHEPEVDSEVVTKGCRLAQDHSTENAKSEVMRELDLAVDKDGYLPAMRISRPVSEPYHHWMMNKMPCDLHFFFVAELIVTAVKRYERDQIEPQPFKTFSIVWIEPIKYADANHPVIKGIFDNRFIPYAAQYLNRHQHRFTISQKVQVHLCASIDINKNIESKPYLTVRSRLHLSNQIKKNITSPDFKDMATSIVSYRVSEHSRDIGISTYDITPKINKRALLSALSDKKEVIDSGVLGALICASDSRFLDFEIKTSAEHEESRLGSYIIF